MPEMNLKGHVDICSKTVIRGWSLATSDLTQRVEMEFVQGDRVIGSVTPSIPAPKLLEVLKVGETQDFRPAVRLATALSARVGNKAGYAVLRTLQSQRERVGRRFRANYQDRRDHRR